jgi:hypothetical protein
VDFFARKNPTASAGFEPAILGTRGQHANHQTTKAAYKHTAVQSRTRHAPVQISAAYTYDSKLYVAGSKCLRTEIYASHTRAQT